MTTPARRSALQPDEQFRTTKPLGAALSGQAITLIATKLYIPPQRRETILRPQLFARLDTLMARKLMILNAPAGFGKTHAAASWLHQRHYPAGWISLDSSDNDPAHFWAYLLAALRDYVPNGGDLTVLTSAEARIEVALTPLINTLAGLHQHMVLVIDDYHLIRSESIQRGMTFLLEHLPPFVHILLLTRHSPALPLARLRARNELDEIGVAELSFREDETAAYLHERLGVTISASDLALLTARTEGWPASLHLAALVLQRHTNPMSVLDGLHGSHRAMFEYLAHEVLVQLTPEIQHFLMHSAILDRFCADVCNVLLERTDAQQYLDEIGQAGLFLVPLDDQRTWFRYHHLFAETLRSHLRRSDPARWQLLHRRAADWFAQQQCIAEAVEYALTAADWSRATELIEQAAPGMIFTSGESVTLLDWQRRMPLEELLARPRFALFFARALLPFGQHAAAEALTKQVEAHADAQHEDIQGLLFAVRTRMAFGSDQIDHCIELGSHARTLIRPEALLLRSDVDVMLASARYIRGQYDEVIALCREVIAQGRAIRYNGNFWVAVGILATTHDILGQLTIGEQFCTQMLQHADQLNTVGIDASPFVGQVQIARGYIRWEQLRLDEAIADFQAGIARLAPTGAARSLFLASVQLLLMQHVRGDTTTLAETRRTTEEWLQRTDSRHMEVLYQATQCHIALIQGDKTAAARWLADGLLPTTSLPQSAYLPEYLQLLQAWRALYFGQADTAHTLIQIPLATAAQGRRLVVWIEALVIRALTHTARGDHAAALEDLAQAVILSEPERIVRPLIEKGAQLRDLLLRLHQHVEPFPEVSLPYLHLLLTSFPPAPAPPHTPSLLTPREHEVLLLLAAGASNRAIAEQLFLSAETVKTYLKQIYRKLEVSTRTQAIAHAREQRLI